VPTPIRVVIVDDHLMVRKGLRLLLEEEGSEVEWVGEATDGESAISLVARLQPNVVLMDIRMPNQDGISALKHIHATHPDVHVLLLTTYDEDELIVQGFQAGASGYLLKDVSLEKLLQAIHVASKGEIVTQPATMARLLARTNLIVSSSSKEKTPDRPLAGNAPCFIELTNREQEVLNGVAQGERSKEIASRLGISERTVRAYLTSIYTKLNVDSRAAAVAVAFQCGLLKQPKDGFSEKPK